VPRHVGSQPFIAAPEGLQPLIVQLGIPGALVIQQPLPAQPEDLIELDSTPRRRRLGRRRTLAGGDLVARSEAAQARLGAAPAAPDRQLARLARKG
jgi:hypothetical protein